MLGTRYRVMRVLRRGRMVGLEGLCLAEDTTILIARNLSPERQLEVLRHELAHAVLHESGCGFALSNCKTEETEEVLVRTFVPAYVSTLVAAKVLPVQ